MSIHLKISENFQLSDAKCNQTNQNLKQTKLSEISEFSVLFIGSNRKFGNLRNVYIFLIKPHHKAIFFLPQVFFFRFWILCFIYYSRLKQDFQDFQDFRVFEFGCRVKSKTRKPCSFLFFLIQLYLKVTFFV